MSRVQLALQVGDLDGSIDFYTKLLGVEPAKLRPGYANFVVIEPPLKLVLLEGNSDQDTAMDHLGIEVTVTDTVHAATRRLSGLGLFTRVDADTTCCDARQNKVRVHGPGREPREIYVVKADSAEFGSEKAATACCDTEPAAAGT